MNVFQIHADDNVAVAVDAVAKGSSVTVGSQTFTVCQDIPAGHKIAIKEIKKGEDVIKIRLPHRDRQNGYSSRILGPYP